MTTRTLAATALAALALAGCGASGDQPAATADAQAPAAAATTTAPTPLSRHDAPPEGVAAQIEIFGIGDQLCQLGAPAPRIEFVAQPFYGVQYAVDRSMDEPEIGESVAICLTGFPADEPIAVEVTGPDGFERHRSLPPVEGAYRYWEIGLLQETALGTYDVTADAGDERAEDSFEVVLPRHRGLRRPAARRNVADRRGDTITLVGVGLAPSTTVPVDLYRASESVSNRHDYVASVEIMTDSRGIGTLELPTSLSDRPGSYLAHPRGIGRANVDTTAAFTLE